MAPKANFGFISQLEKAEGAGPFVSAIIYIPPNVMKTLPQSRVRVKGTMNNAPFSLAVQYRKHGSSFFIVSAPLRKAAKIKVGDPVHVKFSIFSDKVEAPEELLAVLEQDEEGLHMWKTLTPGMQRSLCHYVNGVKNTDNRISRALLLINKVKQGAFSKPRKK